MAALKEIAREERRSVASQVVVMLEDWIGEKEASEIVGD
jgi:hypothetical protein